MFRALGRLLAAFGRLLTGRIDSKRRAVERDPYALQAKGDEAVRLMGENIQRFMDAMSRIVALQKKKEHELSTLQAEVEKNTKIKEGAAAKARQRIAALRAQNPTITDEEIKKDSEYARCSAAFNDFSSTLAEQQKRVDGLQTDIKGYEEEITNFKRQLAQLKRDLDKAREKSAAVVAAVISAKMVKDLNDSIAGLAVDNGAGKIIDELDEVQRQAEAEAEVSRISAGTDSQRAQAEFIEWAEASANNTEFEAAVGLGKPAPAVTAPPATKEEPSGAFPT